jgi:hypothetical protein
MNVETTKRKHTHLKKLLLSTLASGLGMWIIGGLWHNLILPGFNDNVEAHHDGLGITLIAYFILAFLMAYIYFLIYKGNVSVIKGLKFGVLIGILWVFPHGLAMAGTHDTSIIYEFKNTFYHMFEQGIGGIIICLIIRYPTEHN